MVSFVKALSFLSSPSLLPRCSQRQLVIASNRENVVLVITLGQVGDDILFRTGRLRELARSEGMRRKYLPQVPRATQRPPHRAVCHWGRSQTDLEGAESESHQEMRARTAREGQEEQTRRVLSTSVAELPNGEDVISEGRGRGGEGRERGFRRERDASSCREARTDTWDVTVR